MSRCTEPQDWELIKKIWSLEAVIKRQESALALRHDQLEVLRRQKDDADAFVKGVAHQMEQWRKSR